MGVPGWLSWLSVRLLVSAHIMISWFESEPHLSQALHCQCRACLGFFLPLSAPLLLMRSFSLSVSLKQNFNKIFKKRKQTNIWEKKRQSIKQTLNHREQTKGCWRGSGWGGRESFKWLMAIKEGICCDEHRILYVCKWWITRFYSWNQHYIVC